MTVVQTNSGPVRGARENGLAVFKGIPYAAPPVGDLRWMPPQPPEPWTETRDALEFGNIAPQEKSPLIPPALLIDQPESEDCLYLNVYTPGTDGG
ncbi:MAG: carboxylesterase family protein, partial [Gammaproteobacteria bacterium]|nr:carboxylesterase family protein [Gammaproteobacteria bacterium]